jgi:antitoxin component HigA of HigAB toxin-antitoxin module
MALKNYKKVIEETPQEITTFVETSMDILERIHELLQGKFDGKQRLLADKLGKSEAEVSKMLNCVQNFTIKTIARLESAFGAKIIAVCTSSVHAEFMQVKTPPEKGLKRIVANAHGLKEEKFPGTTIQIGNKATSRLKTFA